MTMTRNTRQRTGGRQATEFATTEVGARRERLHVREAVPPEDRDNPIRLGYLRMNGKEVFRFAVTKFREVIEDAFAKTGLTPDDVSQVVCHQSNVRIIDAAREKLNIDPSKIYVNIDRYGNSSAGSVPLCLDELWRAGKITPGKPFMMVAFGGGLTWASSVWNT